MEAVKKFELGPNQRKWLEALKSGKYTHGKRRLCIESPAGTTFCCLGVAADMLNVFHTKIADVAIEGVKVRQYGKPARNAVSVAPQEVVAALRLRDERGIFTEIGVGRDYLTAINDDAATDSYAPIIKLIEESPELVFTEPA